MHRVCLLSVCQSVCLFKLTADLKSKKANRKPKIGYMNVTQDLGSNKIVGTVYFKNVNQCLESGHIW